jgi:hypothetical protein
MQATVIAKLLFERKGHVWFLVWVLSATPAVAQTMRPAAKVAYRPRGACTPLVHRPRESAASAPKTAIDLDGDGKTERWIPSDCDDYGCTHAVFVIRERCGYLVGRFKGAVFTGLDDRKHKSLRKKLKLSGRHRGLQDLLVVENHDFGGSTRSVWMFDGRRYRVAYRRDCGIGGCAPWRSVKRP